VGPLGGTLNIQAIFDLVPRCLKHVWCYRSQSPLCGLSGVDLNLTDNVLHITPQKQSKGVKSGVLWGQVISSPIWSADQSPRYLSVQVIPNTVAECGGSPHCWRIVWDGNWDGAHNSSMSNYERPVTVFSEKKNEPIKLSCIKTAHSFTLVLTLSNSHVICKFWLP
jgi:hypothetical protein